MFIVEHIISKVIEKYGFEIRDFEDDYTIIEYIDDDIEYDEECSFDSLADFSDFADEQGAIVCKDLDIIKKEIENKNVKIQIDYMDWDGYDYVLVTLGLSYP